jgi:hypothetical protein
MGRRWPPWYRGLPTLGKAWADMPDATSFAPDDAGEAT